VGHRESHTGSHRATESLRHIHTDRATHGATEPHTEPQSHTRSHRATHRATEPQRASDIYTQTEPHTEPQSHTRSHRATHRATEPQHGATEPNTLATEPHTEATEPQRSLTHYTAQSHTLSQRANTEAKEPTTHEPQESLNRSTAQQSQQKEPQRPTTTGEANMKATRRGRHDNNNQNKEGPQHVETKRGQKQRGGHTRGQPRQRQATKRPPEEGTHTHYDQHTVKYQRQTRGEAPRGRPRHSPRSPHGKTNRDGWKAHIGTPIKKGGVPNSTGRTYWYPGAQKHSTTGIKTSAWSLRVCHTATKPGSTSAKKRWHGKVSPERSGPRRTNPIVAYARRHSQGQGVRTTGPSQGSTDALR